ncbi:MAG: AsmA family protein, partial [Alistipes sp.]|nr:AsmA family protein [Alistipes sp.]
MKKWSKVVLTILVVLLAVLLIVPMALKGKISQVVKQEANKMLTATLDFEELNVNLLRHFPNASLNLDGLTLISGVEPFVGDTIVAADRISVVVNLMSLFGDEGFEVRRVLLNKPYLHGHVAANGAVNWDVMKPSAEEEEEPAEQSEEEIAESEPSSFRLALRDVTIADARLRYDDDSSSMHA